MCALSVPEEVLLREAVQTLPTDVQTSLEALQVRSLVLLTRVKTLMTMTYSDCSRPTMSPMNQAFASFAHWSWHSRFLARCQHQHPCRLGNPNWASDLGLYPANILQSWQQISQYSCSTAPYGCITQPSFSSSKASMQKCWKCWGWANLMVLSCWTFRSTRIKNPQSQLKSSRGGFG